MSLSHQVTGDVPGRSAPRSATAATGPFLVERCILLSRMTVGTALSNAKCTSRRWGALAPAADWPAAPLPGARGSAGCQNLPQRPRSGRGAREESLIFRAFLRGRSRPGGPLWQIWTTRAAAGPCEGCRGPAGGRGGRPLTSRRALCTRKCSSNRRSRVQNAPFDEEGTGRGRSGPRRRPPWNISSDLMRTQCMLDLRHHGCTPVTKSLSRR